MPPPRLILASRSPRRAALLREAGYAFEQMDPPFDDPPHPEVRAGATPGDLAAGLAQEKAMSLARWLRDRRESGRFIILAADTICIGADGRLIGQPADRDEARRILQGFEGCDHEVVTGVALCDVSGGRCESFSDAAVVAFGKLSEPQIEEYLASGAWRGKAGGYNLFDRQQAGWPVRCAAGGDPTTVVGLPMGKLRAALRRWGGPPEV